MVTLSAVGVGVDWGLDGWGVDVRAGAVPAGGVQAAISRMSSRAAREYPMYLFKR